MGLTRDLAPVLIVERASRGVVWTDDITPVKSVITWAWHARLHLCILYSFFIPIGREQPLKQLCHITRYARRAQHSLIRSCLPEGDGGLSHFIAGGCCVERNHLTIIICAFILLFDQKGDDVFDRKGIYEWESKCVECRGMVLYNFTETNYLDFVSVKLSRTRPHWD